ncbi:zinc finger and SCAN domain-containing protein 2-like isoform X2 [Anguilla anguilla]|uniref:zinc finger and SCAN domain-containing protein 2-like isoform X2 n=1 Tax=Anguilla anguilla TaxID=7936 RepID=UPI0015AB1EEC|nr:zinc finger and SCAN domain-containing protein 2-like isoform X2 [Anguilla anguilla]
MSYTRRSSCVAFQAQLSPILEILAQTAVAEINKLVDDGTTVLRLEMSQNQREIETLKRKVQSLERELRATQRTAESRGHPQPVIVPILDELRLTKRAERVFQQEWSFSLQSEREPAGVAQVDTPVQSRIMRNQSANMEQFRPEPVLIKEERLEEDLCYREPQPTPGGEEQGTQPTPITEEQVTQPTPVEDGKKLDPEPTPAGDPEELSEQHRCEHGDEELSELEFVVKAEQEEEHVAQRLSQTGCEHSAGRLNNLDSEYVMYERDSQLWTSFTQEDSDLETDDPVCSNATEKFSQNLSIHTQLQHAPATMEVSGNTLSSIGASYVEEFDKMSEKPSVCSEELRSEAIHTQQSQYRERLVHTVVRENQTLLPQQQQHGPSVKHMRGSESPAQPHSGCQYETDSTLSTSAFNAGNDGEAEGQAECGRKPFVCIYCGKSFDCCSRLISHHRIHTGEKPFSCAHCGRCFNRKSNLVRHERIHSGNKPFGCTLCGKRFAWGPDLRAHHRSHTGERPYHCTYCGKSFARQCNLVVHRRIHTRVKLYSCV